MTAEPELLSLRGLSVRYDTKAGPIDAAQDVTFSLARGERLGLVGESGSGKTTTALALMGMLRAPGRVIKGEAWLDGMDLLAVRPDARAAYRLSKVSYIPQGAMNSLNPVLKIRQSLSHGMIDHGLKLDRRQRQARIVELLDQVDLPADIAERYPHQLSGGQKQRVCIALAISLGPRLIIADEPTSALDVVTQRQVMSTLREVQERLGSGLILIGHDMGLMAQSVHRLAVMRHGRVVEDGETVQVFSHPAHAYTRELIHSVPMVGEDRQASAPVPTNQTEITQPLLVFDGVRKTYPSHDGKRERTVALDRLSFTLSGAQPRIIAVVGQSGSGKTTMGGMILGLLEPSEGQVRYRGEALSNVKGSDRLRVRREIQAVFQDPYSAFNPFYRVRRALTRPLVNFGLAKSHAEAGRMATEACAVVGLDPSLILDRFAHQLSGGQRQRLMVARALLLRPRLLVADEPVSMVDASLRSTILDSLRDLRDQHEITILYITHDLATAYRVSDYLLVLHRGRIVEAGDPDTVLRDPLHPYTRTLVASIPWPDPAREWGGLDQAGPSDAASGPAATIVRSRLPDLDLAA